MAQLKKNGMRSPWSKNREVRQKEYFNSFPLKVMQHTVDINYLAWTLSTQCFVTNRAMGKL